MTVENIKNQLKAYENKIDIDKAFNDINESIEDAGLELGNIICLFFYNKSEENHIEIEILTCPSVKLDRLIFQFI